MDEIVIDKSWVQGATRDVMATASKHHLIMPEALLYELLTTKQEQQVRCLSRLSKIESCIWLLNGIPELLRYECSSGRPATPLADRCVARSISIHPSAGTTGYAFSEEQVTVIEGERAEREGKGVEELKKMSSVVSGWFPALKNLPAGSPPASTQPYLARIAADPDMICEIYEAIRKPWMPEPTSLSQEWAYFRWLQVRLAGAVEYIRRYGDRNETAQARRIPNFFLDQDYLIPALLVDGLATCDLEMRSFYGLLAPQKSVIGCQ